MWETLPFGLPLVKSSRLALKGTLDQGSMYVRIVSLNVVGTRINRKFQLLTNASWNYCLSFCDVSKGRQGSPKTFPIGL